MSISIDLARRILEACKQRARELRSPVSIAIVDAGGHLVLFERMMSPYGWATGDISIAKANTSVMFNQSTDSVAQWASAIPGFAASLATMTGGKFIMAAGGWPICVNGITVGGLGISGGNAAGRDEEIARAGLAVLGTITPPAFQGQPAQPQPAQYPPPWAQPPIRVAQPMPYQGTAPQPVPPRQPAEHHAPIANAVLAPSDTAVVPNEALGAQQTTSTIHLPENDPYEAVSNRNSIAPNSGDSGG
jgi:uncharacterized protein GlcG (DUF336 family)